jgi:ubiquinone/menaquinone biosynthesis methyltransferase
LGQRRLASAATASSEQRHSTDQESSDFTHFGFEQVRMAHKQERVKQVFDNVADSYDVMNDLMSAGLHRYWKDYLLIQSRVEIMARHVRRSAALAISSEEHSLHPGELAILDVAGGTGDVAFRFVDAAQCLERSRSSGIDPVQVTVCDINTEMLRVGQARARQRYGNALLDETQSLRFVQGNAQELPFEDQSFDLYTIAFGLRNVTDVDMALREAHRVLKPGGRFMCLEFSRVPNPAMRQLYDLYSFHVIPCLGEAVAKDRASYQYLVESIRKFSSQDELVDRMRSSGMQHVRYTNLTGGVVALHDGFKL